MCVCVCVTYIVITDCVGHLYLYLYFGSTACSLHQQAVFKIIIFYSKVLQYCGTLNAIFPQISPHITILSSVAYPGILFRGGVQHIQLRTEDRENGDLGAVAPLVMGPGGSCNLVQEISFHIVKFP